MEVIPGVLAVMAHPDDAELRCFGTLCKFVSRGYRAAVLVMCAGENGTSLHDRRVLGTTIPPGHRVEESRRAFDGTGVSVECCDLPDGKLRADRQLVVPIEERLRQYAPQIVITHFLDQSGVDHSDHTEVAKAVQNVAARVAGVSRVLECEPLLAVRSGFVPNHFTDITPFFQRKMDALKCHATQAGRYYLTDAFHETRSRFYAGGVSFHAASADAKFEAFRVTFSVD